MAGDTAFTGKWMKSGLAALCAGALAVPMVGAFATPVDPTQTPPEEVVEEVVEEAAPAAAALTAEQTEEGRVLFSSWSCGACHVLTDANGNGHIGPSLDGNAAMDKSFIVARVSNGQGAMPGFGGQLTEEEIDLLAAYIMEAKK